MVLGIVSQWWVRTRYPRWFTKYKYVVSRLCHCLRYTDNDDISYIVAAALDGGTQVISFILNFAVFGASGMANNFPQWWGNGASPSGSFMCLSYTLTDVLPFSRLQPICRPLRAARQLVPSVHVPARPSRL